LLNIERLIPKIASIVTISHIVSNVAGCKIVEITTPCFNEIESSSSSLVTAGITKLDLFFEEFSSYSLLLFTFSVYFPNIDILFPNNK
jgi:hypothetical protein